MNRTIIVVLTLSTCFLAACSAAADDEQQAALIASAISAAPPAITDNATIKTMEGEILREGSSDWICYSGSAAIGPMCNQAQWDTLLGAYMAKEPVDVEQFSISYMLAGEGDAIGVSNIDHYATEPTDDNDWVKEGPHLMILVPHPAALEGLSTDPADPVYVMWKGTPYAHIMVRIAAEE